MTSPVQRPAEGGASASREPYHAPVSIFWWLRKGSYTFFVLREITSVFVAWSVVFLLLFVRALSQGDAQYHSFVDWATRPWVVLLNLVTFGFLVLHSVTWFNLTPAAMSVRLRGRPVPPAAVAAGAYAGWVVVSVVVVWLVVTR
jgi:fumarate reductase subunit C